MRIVSLVMDDKLLDVCKQKQANKAKHHSKYILLVQLPL